MTPGTPGAGGTSSVDAALALMQRVIEQVTGGSAAWSEAESAADPVPHPRTGPDGPLVRPGLAALVETGREHLADLPRRYRFVEADHKSAAITAGRAWLKAWAVEYLGLRSNGDALIVSASINWGVLLNGVERGWTDEVLAAAQNARLSLADVQRLEGSLPPGQVLEQVGVMAALVEPLLTRTQRYTG